MKQIGLVRTIVIAGCLTVMMPLTAMAQVGDFFCSTLQIGCPPPPPPPPPAPVAEPAPEPVKHVKHKKKKKKAKAAAESTDTAAPAPAEPAAK